MCYTRPARTVYGEAGPWTQQFLLGGGMSIWLLQEGPAHCIVDLHYWSYRGHQQFNWLASTEFTPWGVSCSQDAHKAMVRA